MVNTESPCQGASSAPQLRPGWVEREGTTLKGGSGENVWVRATHDSQTGALVVAKVYSNATLEQQPELKQMAYNEFAFHDKYAGKMPSAVVPMINSHYDPELFVMGFPYAGRPLLSFVCQPLDAASLWRNALLGCEFVSRVVPAMRWLHGKGLVYLDFKPEQVLAQVDHQARRLLINWVDFGSLAPRGQCCVWTDGFVPPEALACCGDVVGINAAATEAWDAWAVGTVLMIILSAHTPFERPEWQQGLFSGGGGAVDGGCSFRDFCMASPAWTNMPEAAVQLRELAEGLTRPDPAKRLTLDEVEAKPFFQDVRKETAWRQGLLYEIWAGQDGCQAAGEGQAADAAAPGAALHEAEGAEGRLEAHDAPGGLELDWAAERATVYGQLAAAQQAAEEAEALRGEVEGLRAQLQQQRDQAAAALQHRDAAARAQQQAQLQIQAQLRLQLQLQGAAKNHCIGQLQEEVVRRQAEAGELQAKMSMKDEIIAQMQGQMARQQAAGKKAQARIRHLEAQRAELRKGCSEFEAAARRLRAESIRVISEARVKGEHAARLQGYLALMTEGAETARGEAEALRGQLARLQACLGAVREECAAVDSDSSGSCDDDGSEGWAEGGRESQALSGSCAATTSGSAATAASDSVDEASSRPAGDAHATCKDAPAAAGASVPSATRADGAGALAACCGADGGLAGVVPSGRACEGAVEVVSCTRDDDYCSMPEAGVDPAAASIAAGALQQQYAASEEQVQADGASCSNSEQGKDGDASVAAAQDCSVVVIVRVGSPCGPKAAALAIVEGRDCSGACDATDHGAGPPDIAEAMNAGREGAAPGVGAGARPVWWGRLRGRARQAKAALRRGVLAPLCFTGTEADRF